MKRGKMIIAIVIVTVLVLATFSILGSGRLMDADPTYSVTGDNGAAVPAKVFVRKVADGPSTVSEIVVIFDKIIPLKKSFAVLVLVPEKKMIGIPEHGRNAFVQLTGGYVFQKSKDSDKFTSVFNNYTFFEDPPIKQAHFEDKKIIFNSYDALKQFGENITVSWK